MNELLAISHQQVNRLLKRGHLSADRRMLIAELWNLIPI